jgi:hypothetical protein
MAEIVGGLFGVTPESLTAQREAALAQQATNFAQLSPMQAAQAGFYTAGNRLAGVAGGLLGAQDPEMAKAAQRQALLRQVQPSDAEGWKSLATQLWQSGDTQGAQEALAKSQTMTSEATKNALATSQIAENVSNAANRNYNMSPEGRAQELLKSGKYEPSSVANFVAGKGDLTPVDKFTKPSADFIAKAVEFGFGDKPAYGGYTPEQTAKVNQALYEQDISKKKAGATILSPEIKLTNQELDWRKQFLTENKPVVDQGANVRQSLNLLNQGTPFAQAAFSNTVVSAFGGDKQKSNAEIKRLANTGALDTRIANTITNFFEGKTTATTVQDQQNVLNAVDKALEARYTSSSEPWKSRLTKAKVDPSMVVPSYEEVVGTKSAGGQTVNYPGAPATIVSQNADGTIVIEQNGVRKTLAPKK